jgi:hypothetical protein
MVLKKRPKLGTGKSDRPASAPPEAKVFKNDWKSAIVVA